MAKQVESNEEDVFNLSSTEASNYLKDKSKSSKDDGLLRPKVAEGVDGKRELVLRFLPNLTKEGKIKSTSIEKHIHYADFKSNPELQGYFDCLKNTDIGKACPLCDTFWALKNTKNPKDEEKAKLISRSTKYYAYVQVVEDKQKPENEGKIFIFPYGFKIFQKIKSMATNTRKPVVVEDLIYGANLVLIIEEIGGYANYDSSYFESSEPISVDGKTIRIDADGKINPSDKSKVIDFLKSRTHDLEDFRAKDWTIEQKEKADKIISVLSGGTYSASANSDVRMEAKVDKKPLTSAAIFSSDDEDEEDEKPVAKVRKPAIVEDQDETPAPVAKLSDNEKAKKKAAAFFSDDSED